MFECCYVLRHHLVTQSGKIKCHYNFVNSPHDMKLGKKINVVAVRWETDLCLSVFKPYRDRYQTKYIIYTPLSEKDKLTEYNSF